MRLRRASSSNGIVDKRVRVSRQTVLVAAMGLSALWMVGSLLQGLSLNRSLNDQAAALRSQNAALSSTNDGYRRDIAAQTSGAAAEEEARKDGYAKSNEKVYLISTPPPTPVPAAAKKRASTSSAGPLDALRRFLQG